MIMKTTLVLALSFVCALSFSGISAIKQIPTGESTNRMRHIFKTWISSDGEGSIVSANEMLDSLISDPIAVYEVAIDEPLAYVDFLESLEGIVFYGFEDEPIELQVKRQEIAISRLEELVPPDYLALVHFATLKAIKCVNLVHSEINDSNK